MKNNDKMKGGITLLLLIITTFAFTQNDLRNVKIFFKNGGQIEGQIKANFQKKEKLEVSKNGKSIKFKPKTIDSLILDDTAFYRVITSGLSSYYHLRLIKGPIKIYQLGRDLIVETNGIPSINILKNYRLANMYFCTDDRANAKDTIDKITFLNHVNTFNDKGQMPSLKLYDSARSHINIANIKISFLKPEIGLELKLLKNFSFYNALGLNFYGDAFRDARTFINQDGISQLRFYINQKKRIRKGKNIHNFSGVYIAPTYRYLFENAVPDKQYVGLELGIQESSLLFKTYSNVSIGLGYELTKKEAMFSFIYHFGFNL
jgi:hypothetical protein